MLALLAAGCAPPPHEEPRVPTGMSLTDANNYAYQPSVQIPAHSLPAGVGGTIDWSGLSTDFVGHALDPAADVQLAALALFPDVSEADLAHDIAYDAIPQDQVALFLTCDPVDAACALADYGLFGNDAQVAKRFVEGSGTWLAVLASQPPGAGMQYRKVMFLRPDEDATDTVAAFSDDEGWFSVRTDLGAVDGIAAPAGDPDAMLDWSGLRHDGLGRTLALYRLDELEIGHLPDTTLDALSADFVDVEEQLDGRWTLDVAQRSTASLADAQGETGAFPGFSADGLWIVSLRCRTCTSQMPAFFGWVEVRG